MVARFRNAEEALKAILDKMQVVNPTPDEIAKATQFFRSNPRVLFDVADRLTNHGSYYTRLSNGQLKVVLLTNQTRTNPGEHR